MAGHITYTRSTDKLMERAKEVLAKGGVILFAEPAAVPQPSKSNPLNTKVVAYDSFRVESGDRLAVTWTRPIGS